MQYDSDTLAARAEKEEAEARSAKSSSEGQKLPRRYKLYDKIKNNVSLRTVDLVIIITSVLLIAALVIGIVTGKRPQ